MKGEEMYSEDFIVTEWLEAPGSVSLNEDEVHLWRASLDITHPQVKTLKETLSADELSRAERFYFRKDRDRFIVARGLLRLLLGRYLKIKPDSVSFSYGPFGKPALDEKHFKNVLRFNISHSRGRALFAFVREKEIGVDIEYIRSDISRSDIAKKFFSREEFDTMNALPNHQREKAFFSSWTRKEAYLKARGTGIAGSLNEFDFAPVKGSFAGPTEIQVFCKEGVPWLLREFDAGPGYAAALAVEGYECQIKFWQCNILSVR